MKCSLPECEQPAKHLGLCGAHYHRQRRHGDPRAGAGFKGRRSLCSADGCNEPARARELCRLHYNAWWKEIRGTCKVPDCEQPIQGHGLCARHRQRLAKYGDPLAGPPFRAIRGTGPGRRFYEKRREESKSGSHPGLYSYMRVLLGDPCSYCGDETEHIDHIRPLSAGGPHEWHNLTAACAPCNRRKSTRELLEFLLVGPRGGDAAYGEGQHPQGNRA